MVNSTKPGVSGLELVFQMHVGIGSPRPWLLPSVQTAEPAQVEQARLWSEVLLWVSGSPTLLVLTGRNTVLWNTMP